MSTFSRLTVPSMTGRFILASGYGIEVDTAEDRYIQISETFIQSISHATQRGAFLGTSSIFCIDCGSIVFTQERSGLFPRLEAHPELVPWSRISACGRKTEEAWRRCARPSFLFHRIKIGKLLHALSGESLTKRSTLFCRQRETRTGHLLHGSWSQLEAKLRRKKWTMFDRS